VKLTGALRDNGLLEVAGQHGSLLVSIGALLLGLGPVVDVNFLSLAGHLVNDDALALCLLLEVLIDDNLLLPNSVITSGLLLFLNFLLGWLLEISCFLALVHDNSDGDLKI